MPVAPVVEVVRTEAKMPQADFCRMAHCQTLLRTYISPGNAPWGLFPFKDI
ncbi:hypothetical protein DWUX_681 [Desulfovibrio diazotrophicus]|nr:hypothetical protein DWUX_681 [Desulfovibrio diazotrophicus]